MLGHLTRNIILSLILTVSLTGNAQTVVDSLKNLLAETDNRRDSIILLYEIYDCSPYSLQGEILEDLYKLATRHADYHTANDVLKLSSNHYETNDSMQKVLIARAKKLPDSPDKQSTLVYMKVIETSNHARSLTDTEREAKLRDLLAQHTMSEEFETYKRIEYLFQLCNYLRMSTEGKLLTNYFKELQALIDNLPDTDMPLKYMFYTQAAQKYLSNGMIPEAVEANKTLLSMIEKLQKQNTGEWHRFRNYDKEAFFCYRRLLRCHDTLTPEEIDDYYSKIIPLIDRYPSLMKLSGQRKKPTIYYMMAHKRYAEAIPLIKEQLNDSVNTGEEQLYLVDALITAAENVGNKSDLRMALEISNDILQNRLRNKGAESYKELQIIYAVNDLKQANDELRLANEQIINKRHQEQLTFGTVCLVVLVTLLLIVFILYRRSKRLTRNLTRSNAMITDERDALQRAQNDLIKASGKAKQASRLRTDFIKNMSHEIRTPLESIVEYAGLIADCADPDSREYIKQFSDVITLNTDLLLTIVNDVLELPSLENTKVSVHLGRTSVQQICETALDSIQQYLKPDIDLIFANEGDADTIILTDPHRVEQVLINLLINAAKFTEKGSITLEYAISSMNDKITFTVTDTGIGIPQGKEEIIFSRFEKLNTTTQGNGLGLYISRLLAKMLGGSLTLDKDYLTGARFIFTIPIS